MIVASTDDNGVAGVQTPAFVERLIWPAWAVNRLVVSPGFRLRPSLSATVNA